MLRYRHLLQNLAWMCLTAVAVAVGETKMMLDDMNRFFEGGAEYPSDRYEEITSCFAKWNVKRLEESQDAAWGAFYNYYLSNGGVNDTWGSAKSSFIEGKQNKTATFGPLGRTYEVQERCNYVSNVAYYSALIRVCEYDDWNIPIDERAALMKTFASLAVGSAWFHGSMTQTGRQFDGWSVGIAINNAYQIAIRSINTTSRIFLTVSDDLEPTPITELADSVAYMPLNNDVSEWKDFLSGLQVRRSYSATAVALLSFACGATAPFFVICECLVNDIIAPQFLKDDEAEFIANRYLPELKAIIKEENLPLPPWRALPFFTKAFGVTLGLLWAFAFQEEKIPTPCLEGSFFNTTILGAFKTPFVDALVLLLSDIENTDKIGYFGQDIYPGSKFCNRDSPHALWHQLSADSVFELYVVVDEGDKTLSEYKKLRRSQNTRQEASKSIFAKVGSGLGGLRGSWG